MKDNGKDAHRGIADLSPDASLLRKRLEGVSVGETVQYEELSKIIGRSIQLRRSALSRARAILLREKSMVFAPVKGIGIRRLSNDEIARLGQGFMRRISKTATRGMKHLACIENFDALPADAQVAHNAGMSLLAFVRESSTPKKFARVEAAVKDGRQALPSGKMLELFR